MNDREQTSKRLIELKSQHRDMDQAIAALIANHDCDNLQVQRLKKRKLALKDRITRLESSLLPDIIA